MNKLLHIAIIADPELPVPPVFYGGIERIIDMLVKGYSKQGHRVSLFAHADSLTEARLYPYKGKTSGNTIDFIRNTWLINRTLIGGDFDIVHSFGRLAYLLPVLPLRLPKLMSYQRSPTLTQVKKAVLLAAETTLSFTGCSDFISGQLLPYAPSFTIFNGVPLSTYTFRAHVDEQAPLVFLGRVEPIKGTHIAIQVAIASRRKLIIAGNIPDVYIRYFTEEIEPLLNEQIQYIGPVNDTQKNELLGTAAALLMPIKWDEPFGIVMAEALACGTPVIGFKRGAVPEVIKHGLNGFQCTTADEMTGFVKRLHELDRRQIRKDAEVRFSAELIAGLYLRLYAALISAAANKVIPAFKPVKS